MNIIAYTYLLHHIPTNTFYYGIRWKKDCKPEEFWKSYFTSSKKLVPLLRTLFGDESFEFQIRKVFNDIKIARSWESKVLRRMRVLKNPDIWLNRTNNKAIYNEIAPNLGKKLPWIAEFNKKPETIEKRRLSKLGKKRSPFSDKWKFNMSIANKGRKLPPRTEEHKRKISEALKRRAL
jgi:hypothetical protein